MYCRQPLSRSHCGLPMLIAFAGAASCWGQGYSPSAPARQPATGSPTVIHVHHHHYYQPQGGVYGTPLWMQRDIGDYADPIQGRPEASMDPQPWERDWGGFGFRGYLGQQGRQSGLIVSRVLPNSPASKLGLVLGDYILEINGESVGEMSYRELETLFSRMSTSPKAEVSMQVWNSHTRRTSTLEAEFVNDDVIQGEQEDRENDIP